MKAPLHGNTRLVHKSCELVQSSNVIVEIIFKSKSKTYSSGFFAFRSTASKAESAPTSGGDEDKVDVSTFPSREAGDGPLLDSDAGTSRIRDM